MNIKDYLHLYIGCDVKVGVTSTAILTTSQNDAVHVAIYVVEANPAYELLLRPLSDMTDEERSKYASLIFTEEAQDFAKGTVYLLSKHFDLFGLIDAGLAIDRTKEVAK